jgi:hypothetical protein
MSTRAFALFITDMFVTDMFVTEMFLTDMSVTDLAEEKEPHARASRLDQSQL